jgi:hypothetical protein
VPVEDSKKLQELRDPPGNSGLTWADYGRALDGEDLMLDTESLLEEMYGENSMRLEKGQRVTINVYKKRPGFWESGGAMDRYMGTTVTVRSTNSTEKSFRIEEDDGRWVWRFEDAIPVELSNNPNILFCRHKDQKRKHG